jgi:DNA-binding transcriptional ArsR family regulator
MGTKRASRADAILHPQRMRIVRALAQGPRTAKELLAAMPDVSQASMYRHVALLHETGILAVVEERPLRGAVERTYGLAGEAIVSAAELAEATRDDHFRYFATFAAGLMGEYGAYLDREEIDVERDGVGYREHVLHLTRDELTDMLAELRAVLAARLENAPSQDRAPRLLATVTMPITRQEKDRNDAHR